MLAFNSWYYSFSPYVAPYVKSSDAGAEVMRLVLYPLIGITRISAYVADIATLYVHGLVLVGLVASSLIGGSYLSPVLFFGLRGKRLRSVAKLSASILGISSMALMAGEVVGSGTFLAISSAAFVISSMMSSAAIAAFGLRSLPSRKASKPWTAS